MDPFEVLANQKIRTARALAAGFQFQQEAAVDPSVRHMWSVFHFLLSEFALAWELLLAYYQHNAEIPPRLPAGPSASDPPNIILRRMLDQFAARTLAEGQAVPIDGQ